ncbi:histone-lysine N-methyltransferase SETD1B-A [Pangasianodon hypophthalmus]|uniref:histone-lysine N-methyltransferase SETD1B-A n=1 Tax=Pangasianodon hypophthalmus TaxID=310915 RepID=UPI00230821AC|nr:histone-lysine N-methyltransferase SETD1B-A [Pangasianodon hypophthalmus]
MMSDSGEKEGDNECVEFEVERAPNWSSYKLLVDPLLDGGKEKLYRYDGLHFSAPNPGIHPPEVRDPRIARFWTKFKETNLPVPKFKIDENYVGPPKEVTFARLNDNIKAGFLTDMCRKFGEVQEVEVLFNPKNKKHLGIAKVIFETVRGANDAVQKLHSTSVMGNRIHVELDPRGEKRMQYFQLLVSGLYTPFTLPLGEEAWGPQSPTYSSDSHSEYDPVKRLSHGLLSSSSALLGSTPFDCSTPMSMDTAYSSMHQDTPCSFWQDTPHGSPMSHSNPGTPPHCEGLTNTTDTHTDTHASKNIPHSTPFITSESQYTYHNPHLVQLTPPTPNTRQGSLISITQMSWTSKGHMVSGGQSHKVGRAPRGGHRDRAWGTKYQNAYNRRPEHRYVHRPGFNRSHYRSGCTTNLVPLVTFQGPSAAQTQLDTSLAPLIQCSSSTNKPTEQTAMEAPIGNMDKEPSQPVSQIGNLRQIQTLCSQPLGKTLDIPQKTPHNIFNSPPHVPEVQQQDTAVIKTPERCVSPEPHRSPSLESLHPEPVPSSLDSRIKMLLGTQSPDSEENVENSNSEDWVSADIPQLSSKSGPSSPQSPDASRTLNFPASPSHCSSTQQTSLTLGFEDVSPFPLPDSAEEGEEPQPSNENLSKIPVISTFCSMICPAQQPFTNKLSLREGEASEEPTGPGTCSSPAPPVFPVLPPPVLLPPPPPRFPTLPPPVLPPMCGPSPPLLPPVPVRITSPPPNFSGSPAPFCLPPKLPMGQVNRPPRWTNPPAPPPSAALPIPTRITQGKSHTVFPPPFAILPPPTPFPGLDGVRQAPCPTFNSAALPGYRAPWPPALLPVFDPSVPPPGYLPVSESLHKATVDGVMAAVAAELKAIVKKDILRRMVEGVAFAGFDQWWDEREHSAKISMVPLKSGESKEKGPVKLKVFEPWQTVESVGSEGTILGTGLGVGLRSALKLPSFKVKRKDPSGEDPVEAKKSCPSSSPGHTLSEEAEAGRETHMQDEEVDEPQKEQGVPVVKRRHARPLELDSDDDEEQEEEEEEEEISGNMEELVSEQEERDQAKISISDQEDDDEGEEEGDRKEGRFSAVKGEGRLSAVREDETHSDKEVISIASSESSSIVDYESTLSSRSDLSSSDESHYSSECEEYEEDDEDDGESPSSEAPEEERAVEEIWISSDEDVEEYVSRTPARSSVNSWEDELDPPLTPSAPLSNDGDPDDTLLGTDPQEELRVQVFLHSYGCQDPVTQHLSNKLELSDPALLSSAHEPELQRPPSPAYRELSSDEGLETDLEDPGYTNELLEDSGNLRPPTPTGSLSESEPELELRHGLAPPAADEVELPCTPGGGFETETETLVLSPARTTPLPLPPSPTGFHLFPSPPLYLSPPPLPSSYPAYEETPKTPGRNNREEQRHHTAAITQDAVLRMAMHSPFSPSFLSVSPHTGSGVPRTPGRDTDPSSPLSEDSEANFQQRQHWQGRRPRYLHQFHVHSTSSSPYSSDSSSSQTRDLSFSTNQLAGFDVAHLRKRRERMQRKRRMILSQRNRRNTDDFQHMPVRSSFTKSSCDSAPDLSMELAAQAKKPLQGLENRLENRLHQGPLESQRLPKPLYPWRKRKSWPHTSLFAPRSRRRERLLIDAVWTKGVNMEEIGHLKATYERMLLQNNTFDWLRSTHWVPHPPSSVPLEWPPKLPGGVRYHMTGSARTEGFYIISKGDKLHYLRHTHAASGELTADTQYKNAPAQLPSSSRSGSDFRAEQRRLLSSFSCDSDLLKFNQLKFRKKRLRFSRSRIHDWGLFAEEPIAADEMVIEYVGQSIRQVIADMRERRYEQEGIGSSYLFRVDQDTIIDATKCGNLARFINHSCNPNCYAKVITVEAKKKIVIYSRQPISVNEEITYDYKFPIEDEKIPCLCGAENCRRTLN